jgi:DNA-binding response OmpR family regulator
MLAPMIAPTSSPPAEVAGLAPFTSPDAASPRILVVDDEPAIRSLLATFFHRQGFEVTTASEMEEAAALLELRRYHLVVTDLGLTSLDRLEGLEIVHEARYRWPHLRVLVMTGKTDPRVRDACLASGADAFLVKPQPLAEVHRVVASLLASAERS